MLLYPRSLPPFDARIVADVMERARKKNPQIRMLARDWGAFHGTTRNRVERYLAETEGSSNPR